MKEVAPAGFGRMDFQVTASLRLSVIIAQKLIVTNKNFLARFLQPFIFALLSD
jgi:hypothetical protein